MGSKPDLGGYLAHAPDHVRNELCRFNAEHFGAFLDRRAIDAGCDDITRCRHGWLLRPIAARMLCRYAGLTQRQTADLLKLGTGAAVSMQQKKLTLAATTNRKLQRRLTAIEKAIENEIDQEPEGSNRAF